MSTVKTTVVNIPIISWSTVWPICDNFVEEIKGEEIVWKRAPDSPKQRKGKTGVEAGLGMFFQAAHVSGRVEHGNHPQKRRGKREHHW